MPLYYITGIETAGKTTACSELRKLGYEAYDIDDGIAHHHNRLTGQKTAWPENALERTEDWHRQHDYMMERAQIEKLVVRAADKYIFVCGTTQKDQNVIDLFEKVIYLKLDRATLQQRLANRNIHPFTQQERENILGWRQLSEQYYADHGAAMIDATQPTEIVVDQILNEVSS